MARKMILAASAVPPGLHAGGWRLPEAASAFGMGYAPYVELAQAAERAGMHCLMLASPPASPRGDMAAGLDENSEHQQAAVRLDPLQLASALAMTTSALGLVATTTVEVGLPYHVARRHATLDHVSGGRGGWSVDAVMAVGDAANYDDPAPLEADGHRERVREFFDICLGLWDSWEGDAILRDKATGIYYDPAKVHVLNHKGRFYSVRGPLNVARCPQGRPVIVQETFLQPDADLMARTADLAVTVAADAAEAKRLRDDLRGRAEAAGRDPDHLKILSGFMPIIAASDGEALELRERLRALVTPQALRMGLERVFGAQPGLARLDQPFEAAMPGAFASGRQQVLAQVARHEKLTVRQLGERIAESQGLPVIAGSPKTIADSLQAWFESGAADGFAVAYPYVPGPTTAFCDQVIPELQARGVFRAGYEGKTLRENLGLPVPKPVWQEKIAASA